MASSSNGLPDKRNTSATGAGGSSSTFVNPYIAYVAEIDPDGTMDDGRAYVGGARHYVDKPTTTKSAALPSNTGSRPASGNTRSVPANPTPTPSVLQAQSLQRQQPEPPSKFSSKQRFARPDRDSRWSGRALATADQLPEGFFGTAKPISSLPATQKSSPRVEDSSASWENSWQATPARNTFQSSFSSQSEPRTVSHPQDYGTSWAQPESAGRNHREGGFDIDQSFDRISLNHSGREREYNRAQPSSNRPSLHDQSFESLRQGSTRSTIPSAHEFSYESDNESSSTSRSHQNSQYSMSRDISHRSSQSNTEVRHDHRPYQYNAEVRHEKTPTIPYHQGSPLFLQYPIGDGCHVVVAMYVEKDAQTALKRFPDIDRTRQESGRRDKTLDEMAVIFKEALEDEKKSLTG
ncbi:hypothetical protein BGZ46_001114 [Entomortierella lignicola]|nr:hypothetical protein BGZ46_001114 [Entomortierella lignicola]